MTQSTNSNNTPIQGQWTSDGSDATGKASWTQESVSDSNATRLHITTTGGSPMNTLYEMDPSNTFYLQVTCVEIAKGSISVGVAAKEEFQPGYKGRGMFYNGNLTNGSAALNCGYGPRLRVGDVVVMEYAQLVDDNNTTFVQVKVHLNGECLGVGFKVPIGETDPNAFFPCIAVHGDITLDAIVWQDMPDTSGTDLPPKHPLAGDWSIIKAINSQGETYWPFADPSAPTKDLLLNLDSPEDMTTSNKWGLHVKICNSLGTRCTLEADTNNGGDDTDSASSFLWTDPAPRRLRMTMMMPPPPFHALERQMNQDMGSHWTRFALEEDNSKLVVYGETNAPMLECTRVQRSDAPACVAYKK